MVFEFCMPNFQQNILARAIDQTISQVKSKISSYFTPNLGIFSTKILSFFMGWALGFILAKLNFL